MEKKDLEFKVEQVLHAADNIRRAEANPYLATRVIARLSGSSAQFIQPRIAWQFIGTLSIILLLNASIHLFNKQNKNSRPDNNPPEYFTNHIYTY